MSTVKLMELEPGLSMYVASTLDAEFIHAEIFREGCYDLPLPDDRSWSMWGRMSDCSCCL